MSVVDRCALQEPSVFNSARLPKYAPLVQSLEISGKTFNLIHEQRTLMVWWSGYIPSTPLTRKKLPEILVDAIQTFANLQSVTLMPVTFRENAFTDTLTHTLKALKNVKGLTCLTVNQSCTDDVRAPLLAEICGLQALTIRNPTRAILQLLPNWLQRLKTSLVELHLQVRASP